MTTAVETPRRTQFAWTEIAWFGALALACYAPILLALVRQWNDDPDMSHGFFVPLVVGYILWQRREELMAMEAEPNWWGLAVAVWGALQLWIGTLAVELFLTRTAFVITIIGVVWLMCGTRVLRELSFPLILCFFMIPIPAVIYNSLTFKLQLVASSLAEHALDVLSVPVLREGNVLVLPNQTLSVVDACSGIRSLLSLTFLSLVYGYFFEKRQWMRVVLFFATVPIAIVANGSRVTFAGLMTQINPDLAEGAYHEASGWIIFMVALLILVGFHHALSRTLRLVRARRAHAVS
ncbi:MAG TPA: exosortase/archaeosortase family protein [Bryobacteraceae bacterium]|nr:exosortase/archaeosortase family protein [Bryobacteraceae bacterium]